MSRTRPILMPCGIQAAQPGGDHQVAVLDAVGGDLLDVAHQEGRAVGALPAREALEARRVEPGGDQALRGRRGAAPGRCPDRRGPRLPTSPSMSSWKATTGMSSRMPCREPLLMVMAEKRLSCPSRSPRRRCVARGSVWASPSRRRSAAFSRRSSTTSRVVRSICAAARGPAPAPRGPGAAGGWSPRCRRTSGRTR